LRPDDESALQELRCNRTESLQTSDNIEDQIGMKAASVVCMPIETYRDLETWQACMDVRVDTYQLTESFLMTNDTR